MSDYIVWHIICVVYCVVLVHHKVENDEKQVLGKNGMFWEAVVDTDQLEWQARRVVQHASHDGP